MKRLQKFAMLCLALAFTLGFAGGCGGPKKNVLYVLSFKPEYNEIFEEVNKIFLKENPSIKSVDYKAVDTNNYNTVFSSRIQSGYLDVFTSEVIYMMQGTNAYMRPLAHKDYMDEIDSYFLTQGSFYDPASGQDPQLLTLPLEQCAYVVYYNKDIFAEYDLQVPTTWTEFKNVLQTFADAAQYPPTGKTKIESPLIFGGKSEWPAMTILDALVADSIDERFFAGIADYDNDPTVRFNNAAWTDVFDKMREIGSYVGNSVYGLDYSFATTYFSVGNPTTKKMYPMMIDGTWAHSQIRADFALGAFSLPSTDIPPEGGKKKTAVKTGTTLSVYNRSNKAEYAEKYLEIFFRDEIYARFAEFTKTPSVKTTVQQSDALVNEIFDENKYTFVQAYDARMPRYFPLVSASEATALLKRNISADNVAGNLQKQVDLTKSDWQKYTSLSHGK